uniref:ATP-grasp domain-containing protein n=1 Tax=Acrobeloides nanus TaxID=290746 RepID=A0A914CU19_9BILA
MAPQFETTNEVLSSDEKVFPLTQTQKQSLKQIGDSKRVVVIFIKWKYHVLTNLENLQKPEDAALVGFFAEQTRAKLPECVVKHFDEIFWFKADYSCFESLFTDLKLLNIPELDSFLSQAVNLISRNKLRLIESEEWVITTLCHFRKKYQIPGPSYDDLEPLRNKALEKMVAEAEGVPSAKFALLDFKNMFNINTEVDRIKRLIGTFPMFRKPVHGAGCGGCARINDEKELLEWIRETVDEEYDGVCAFLSIRS